jgi:hypothetical protein
VIHERPRTLAVMSIGFKKKSVEIIFWARSRLRNYNGPENADFANAAPTPILDADYSVTD